MGNWRCFLYGVSPGMFLFLPFPILLGSPQKKKKDGNSYFWFQGRTIGPLSLLMKYRAH